MTATSAPAESPFTPSAMRGRSVAPDLARGVMLLLIAIANSAWYLWGSTSGFVSAHPLDGSALDKAVQTVAIIAVDGRTYPMFAFLFGYGIWQLYTRQHAAGVPHAEARRLLRRRHLWMLVFGGVHALLLWMGDVVGAYGLAGLVLVALFLDRKNAALRIAAIVLGIIAAGSALTAAVGVVLINMMDPTLLDPAALAGQGDTQFMVDPIAQPNYLIAAAMRFGFWLVLAPGQGLLMLVVPIAILVAILAARAQILEKPEEHLPLLRRTAVIGIAIGWGFGLLTALQNLGVFGLPRSYDFAFFSVSAVAGLATGIGYVAVFGLIAARMRGTGGPISHALQAVGKRSLTFYLAQSVIFAPVMSAWGLGLGEHLSTWSIVLFAFLTWLVLIPFAVALERAGKKGPAEWLLRRLAYPRR